MSRAPHSRWHDAAVLATAATTILAIWATYHLTEPTTSAPDTSPSARAETHTTTLLSGQPSRGGARTTPPPPRGVGALNVRGRSEPNGERKPRPAVDHKWPNYRQLSTEPEWVQAVAQCVYEHESINAGLYNAQSPNGLWFGAAQFLDSTWYAVTGLPGHASDYGPKVQDDAFATLFDRGAGAGHWPGLWGEC